MASNVYPEVMAAAEQWLRQRAGGLDSKHLSQAITQRYGKDKTFSVPILTMCAIAGRFGEGRKAWEHHGPSLRTGGASSAMVCRSASSSRQLRTASLDRHWTSQAPPRSFKNPHNPRFEESVCSITLRRLSSIQPSSGGFLEATPLTSFVVMSLAASGEAREHSCAEVCNF